MEAIWLIGGICIGFALGALAPKEPKGHFAELLNSIKRQLADLGPNESFFVHVNLGRFDDDDDGGDGGDGPEDTPDLGSEENPLEFRAFDVSTTFGRN